MDLPESYREALAGAPEWPRVYEFYRRNWGLYDEGTARRYIALNLLQVELLDRAVGRFVAALRQRGLYDQALVVFTGDHGEMNCERALVDKGVYGHPKVALVPLAVKLPGGEAAGREVAAPVSLLDLAPTFLEAAGVTPAERLDGESLLASLCGPGRRDDKPLLFEAGWHVCPNPAVALFTQREGRRLMYTYNLCDPRDELYDRSAAPSPSRGSPRWHGCAASTTYSPPSRGSPRTPSPPPSRSGPPACAGRRPPSTSSRCS